MLIGSKCLSKGRLGGVASDNVFILITRVWCHQPPLTPPYINNVTFITLAIKGGEPSLMLQFQRSLFALPRPLSKAFSNLVPTPST